MCFYLCWRAGSGHFQGEPELVKEMYKNGSQEPVILEGVRAGTVITPKKGYQEPGARSQAYFRGSREPLKKRGRFSNTGLYVPICTIVFFYNNYMPYIYSGHIRKNISFKIVLLRKRTIKMTRKTTSVEWVTQ